MIEVRPSEVGMVDDPKESLECMRLVWEFNAKQNGEEQAEKYARDLWNDPDSSPVCQYQEDNKKTFLAGFRAGVKFSLGRSFTQ